MDRRGADAVDLEVQLSASSVGELEGLEVGVLSRLDPATPEDSIGADLLRGIARSRRGSLRRRWPRARFATVPVRSPFRRAAASPQPLPVQQQYRHRRKCAGLFYTEMVHPDDLFRRVLTEPIPAGSATIPGGSIRYALFGLELEKGVILRARLRGQLVSFLESRRTTPPHSMKISFASPHRSAHEHCAPRSHAPRGNGLSAARRPAGRRFQEVARLPMEIRRPSFPRPASQPQVQIHSPGFAGSSC